MTCPEHGGGSPTAPLILIIEDDTHISMAVRICLEKAGFRVATALDGVDGLEQAFSLRPSLILLDLLLPKLDGHMVLKALRQDERTSSIPVVVLSAVADPAEREAALEEGAADYIVKPFTPQELLSVVRRELP
ncbi:MAG: response regulator [Firmicutes bacterium]|nr:response regulator [Candidatus Fermentithermobacillaceae bacterium]